MPDIHKMHKMSKHMLKTSSICCKIFNVYLTFLWTLVILGSATGGALQEKVFLKISQYSQKNTCVGVPF